MAPAIPLYIGTLLALLSLAIQFPTFLPLDRPKRMDCVIPGHSVRPFCAAIGCLSRIGKDLYVDFDPLDGLTLRALNEAKSAFGSFSFAPSFFERCSEQIGTSHTSTNNSTTSASRSSRKRVHHVTTSSQSRYTCRIPLRAMAAIVRPRKGVLSLRLFSNDDEKALLSFEFWMPQRWRVVHRMATANAQGVSAVAPKDACSELVASPNVLLRMLEPVQKQRTAEVAIILNDKYRVMTATSFHHGDVAAQSSNNALLHATTTATLLKTETSIGCDELEEFHFCDDRKGDGLPEHVNEEVVLVFGAKETKAMLQFCAGAHLDEELLVSISFHWGGKPVTIETKGASFSAQLILATLDHKLLAGFRPAEAAAERDSSRAQ